MRTMLEKVKLAIIQYDERQDFAENRIVDRASFVENTKQGVYFTSRGKEYYLVDDDIKIDAEVDIDEIVDEKVKEVLDVVLNLLEDDVSDKEKLENIESHIAHQI